MIKNFNTLRNVSAIFNLAYLQHMDSYGFDIQINQKQNCY